MSQPDAPPERLHARAVAIRADLHVLVPVDRPEAAASRASSQRTREAEQIRLERREFDTALETHQSPRESRELPAPPIPLDRQPDRPLIRQRLPQHEALFAY